MARARRNSRTRSLRVSDVDRARVGGNGAGVAVSHRSGGEVIALTGNECPHAEEEE